MPQTLSGILSARKGAISKWSQRGDVVKAKGRKVIDGQTRIFTIGSCFASNLAAYMNKLHLNGSTHPGRPYYHSAAILQEFQRLLEGADAQDALSLSWKTKAGYIHPYKHHIDVPAFETAEMCTNWSDEIDDQAKRALLGSDVIVVTLGLIEVWYHQASQTYFKGLPPREAFDQLQPEFRRLTVTEMVTHLRETRALINKHLDARIILTVSPIPLLQTFMPYDVQIANNESKSRIRAAVSEFIDEFDDVEYFPSYEMVVGAECKDDYMKKDGRHLHSYALRFVLQNFIETFCTDDIPPPEVCTRWLTAPQKRATTPNLAESFSLERAEHVVNELRDSGQAFYVLGLDEFAQEFVYSTNVFDLGNFMGFVAQSSLVEFQGFPVQPLTILPTLGGRLIVATPYLPEQIQADIDQLDGVLFVYNVQESAE